MTEDERDALTKRWIEAMENLVVGIREILASEKASHEAYQRALVAKTETKEA